MRQIAVIVLILMAFVGIAWGVSSDTSPETLFDNYGGVVRVIWANMTSTGNTTAYTLPFVAQWASCEMIVTNAATTDRTVALQTSLGGSQFSNASGTDSVPDHVVTPANVDTLKFGVINKGMRDVRFRIVSGTMDAVTDIQPTCYFGRNR